MSACPAVPRGSVAFLSPHNPLAMSLSALPSCTMSVRPPLQVLGSLLLFLKPLSSHQDLVATSCPPCPARQCHPHQVLGCRSHPAGARRAFELLKPPQMASAEGLKALQQAPGTTCVSVVSSLVSELGAAQTRSFLKLLRGTRTAALPYLLSELYPGRNLPANSSPLP